jgi:hypothetical protein
VESAGDWVRTMSLDIWEESEKAFVVSKSPESPLNCNFRFRD